ncbi:undecaprenyl-diphosphate phosphatase [Euzebya tangerina]|uniref:undecaprenyl-diphosphate phosphatase n=1 Tax=Euzebya tangerina TaxID=591198 RepID=UPI0013C34C9B|nr:undecaprenyl-diphosphate phosphatase [Euzebya tangerina]
MFPAWLEALILGVVQGLTEFIPVSSSGHLTLVPYLAGWEPSSLAFDVVLHLGTMFAVLLFFRGELMAIIKGILRLDRSAQGQIYRRVGLLIVPASVPIALVGLLFKDQVEEAFGSPLVASSMLLVTALLLLAMEGVRSRRVEAARETVAAGAVRSTAAAEAPAWEGDWRGGGASGESGSGARGESDVVLPLGVDDADPLGTTLADLTLKQVMIAGALQCLAVLPGVSRSGATITAGVFAGLTREAATRFSFLLVIPALVGATLLSLGDLGEAGSETAVELLVGIVAAFVSGYLAIRFLVALVSRERLTGFAYYCVAAAMVGFIGYAMIGPAGTV